MFVFIGAVSRSKAVLERARSEDNPLLIRRSKFAYSLFSTLLVFSLITLGVAILHVGCSYAVRDQNACLSNMRQLGMGLALYTQDYDEHLPPTKSGLEAVARDGRHLDGITSKCPSATSPFSYGMNAAIGGKSLADFENTSDVPELFEADALNLSFTGGLKDVTIERHSGSANIICLDGHSLHGNSLNLDKLKWTPSTQRKP